ncbi:MAG: transposase zinc-binding domain-containing protein [Oligoflexus sp.]
MGEPQKHVYTYQSRQPEETVIYKVLVEHIETFIAQREADSKGLPEFVAGELRGFLRCGILQYGFLRTKCKACDFERTALFSRKGRGFYPSCCGKRMAEKAYHLIDNVLPEAPYRQWVLSLPIPLRFWMATNKKLTSKVHQIASKEFTSYYTRIAKSKGIENLLQGSITFIQRFGSACNFNTHFHLIALEGVYAEPHSGEAAPRFVAFEPPTDREVCDGLSMKQRLVAIRC